MRTERHAGTGLLPGFSGDGGPASQAQLYCALGIAFGPDGAVYVDDHVNNRIRQIDASGTISTVVGSGAAGLDLGSWTGDDGPATRATLQEPAEIVFDAAGNLYISDRDNNRIRKVDRYGIITTIAGNGKTGYEGDGVLGYQTSIEFPLGIVVDAKGNVIFADEGNKRIRMIDHLTGIIATIAGNGVNATTGDGGPAINASIGDPGALIFDAAGNLYLGGTGPPAFRRIGTRWSDLERGRHRVNRRPAGPDLEPRWLGVRPGRQPLGVERDCRGPHRHPWRDNTDRRTTLVEVCPDWPCRSLARPEGLEPPTLWSEARCSIR